MPNRGTGNALAINDSEDVVGWFGGNCYDSNIRAALWKAGKFFNLNELIAGGSGWLLKRAYDVNNKGQIVGEGTLNGYSRGFLLTPVPEPASFAVLAAGVIGFLLRRRR